MSQTRTALAAVGAAGAVGALLLAVMLREAPPAPPPARPPTAPTAPSPSPSPPHPDAPVAPVAPAPPGPAGELVRRARDVVARGPRATDEAAEAALGAEMEALLRESLGLGDEERLQRAELLLARGEPTGVQELGARLLVRADSPAARARLVALARERGRAVEVRLHALRGLERAPELTASGALADLALDRQDDPGLRAFAAHLLIASAGGASFLEELALDPQDDPLVRGAALEALFEGPDLARARRALEQVQGEPALAEVVAALRGR